MQATRLNTIFVTACTHRNDAFYATMATARKNDIFVDVLHSDAPLQNLWDMKIKPLYAHLTKEKRNGKKYVVFFDAYDVIFMKHRDTVLSRFNEIYNDKVIFNADYPRSLYPYTNTNGLYDHDPLKSSWLIEQIQQGDTETSRLLNSGLFAGAIEHVLHLLDMACLVKSDFSKRNLALPYAERLYEDLSVEKVMKDDQLAIWLTMLRHPDLFYVDSKKEFVTVAATSQMTASNVNEYRQTTPNRPVKDGTYIGDAVIIHSAGGSYRNMGFIHRYGLHEPITTNTQVIRTFTGGE